MKILRAFVATDSVIPVLSALREAGGRPFVPPSGESAGSEYESLLLALVSDRRRAPEVVRIQAICDDGDADRSIAAVTTTAQAISKEPSIVLVTSWDAKKATVSSRPLRGGVDARPKGEL